MYWWDPTYFLFIAPAVILALWAQFRVHSAYAAAGQVPAPLTGAAAARHILDSAGLTGVAIDIVPGHLTDHYDPRDRVLRLSEEVFHSRSLAAVGIAAHEAGHAIQHAWTYAPLVVRNLAVPAAAFGGNASILMLIFGFLLIQPWLVLAGIIAFSGVVVFQLVNLPVEFNASARAKAQLVQLGIVSPDQMRYVNAVLNAAALTYVAATLQAILTLLYYVMRYSGMGRDRD
jgi:Zn-dependent membrane protease YugP